ncbi:MAG: hypothetical protein V9H26_04340 [Verrucomicrobiota bacterium]
MERPRQASSHARTARLAEHDLGDVVLARRAQQAAHHVVVRRGDDFRAEFAGGGEIFLELGLARASVNGARILHMHR